MERGCRGGGGESSRENYEVTRHRSIICSEQGLKLGTKFLFSESFGFVFSIESEMHWPQTGHLGVTPWSTLIPGKSKFYFPLAKRGFQTIVY